ncbi:hypothetical protein RRG08_021706 [Elysia crispata]|uniref:Uncharacterized protein n=1 Tax=Elysia crispata TaxID=231223 RepID=A0AAE0ZXW3_9GAST|nr:hypothetical protein RRG08_021706 [Elysia crispata]
MLRASRPIKFTFLLITQLKEAEHWPQLAGTVIGSPVDITGRKRLANICLHSAHASASTIHSSVLSVHKTSDSRIQVYGVTLHDLDASASAQRVKLR